MKDIVKNYSNDDITIVWKPDLCIHSMNCWKGLIDVFNPKNKPWVNPYGASSERIIGQVDKCPSKALSYFRNDEKKKNESMETNNEVKEIALIEIVKDGPLIVHGDIALKNSNGNEYSRRDVCALCRCGASNNKPFCDGSHLDVNFKG